jgi:hypothetical protein
MVDNSTVKSARVLAVRLRGKEKEGEKEKEEKRNPSSVRRDSLHFLDQ